MKITGFYLILFFVLFNSGCKRDNPIQTGGSLTEQIQPGSSQVEVQGKWIGYIYGFTSDLWSLDISNNHINGYGTIINNSMDWFVGTISMQSNTNPKNIDIKVNDGSDTTSINKTLLGIYRISGDSLFIVTNAPDSPVRPTSFTDSKARKFITIKEYRVKVAPPQPVLLSPDSNATDISFSPTLNWNKYIEAASYSVQVANDSGFKSILIQDSMVTGTSLQLQCLLSSKQYWWRVKARNSYGISPWSKQGRAFTVLTATVTGTPCPGLPAVTYEGQVYHTALIRNQCWLRENLNVGTMVDGHQAQGNNGKIEKYCYNNDTVMCDLYGGLYQWDEAMQYAPSGYHVRGICPPGWHLPETLEFTGFDNLLNSSSTGNVWLWFSNFFIAYGQVDESNASANRTGFSALLAGNRETDGSFNGLRVETFFWSSLETNNVSANTMKLNYINESYLGEGNFMTELYKSNGFSVRCLKD